MLMLGNVLAAGSVESKKALSILDSIAGTKQMFEQNYKIGKGAAGQRLGKQWVHLSGMVLPPFEIRMHFLRDRFWKKKLIR